MHWRGRRRRGLGAGGALGRAATLSAEPQSASAAPGVQRRAGDHSARGEARRPALVPRSIDERRDRRAVVQRKVLVRTRSSSMEEISMNAQRWSKTRSPAERAGPRGPARLPRGRLRGHDPGHRQRRQYSSGVNRLLAEARLGKTLFMAAPSFALDGDELDVRRRYTFGLRVHGRTSDELSVSLAAAVAPSSAGGHSVSACCSRRSAAPASATAAAPHPSTSTCLAYASMGQAVTRTCPSYIERRKSLSMAGRVWSSRTSASRRAAGCSSTAMRRPSW